METFGPLDVLRKSDIASAENPKPPLYSFGFPYTTEYAFRYAMKHRFRVAVRDEAREDYGLPPAADAPDAKFNFADVTDDHLRNPRTHSFLVINVRLLFHEHLCKLCDWPLADGRPFSADWDLIVSFWSNRDVHMRWVACRHKFDDIVEILEEALNDPECKPDPQLKSSLQWWLDWDNNVVCCVPSVLALRSSLVLTATWIAIAKRVWR